MKALPVNAQELCCVKIGVGEGRRLMSANAKFKGSRSFLYLGLGLVLLTLVCLPITIRVQLVDGVNLPLIFDPSGVDAEFKAGLVIAPIFGVWGIASLILGITDLSLKKKALYYLPLFALNYPLATFMAWVAINYRIYFSFWWIYFGLFLAPIIGMTVFGLPYLKRREKIERTLNNQKTRNVIFCFIAALPLFYAVGFWLYLVL
jgi:hypothetical protein